MAWPSVANVHALPEHTDKQQNGTMKAVMNIPVTMKRVVQQEELGYKE